jgi:hypothetical protein
MNAPLQSVTATPDAYARAIAASKKARWEIDRDVFQKRSLSRMHKFLPDGLSLASQLSFLDEEERRLVSQVQGRSYANIFGLVERFINAKVLELSGHYWLGNQTALEALVRFSDEELKHQELFRRLEAMTAAEMPAGYELKADPDQVAQVVLKKSTWAVLGLTCHIELFTQAHYRESIEADATLSPLWKDVFRFHWMEESQHAVLDELEWQRENAKLSAAERDHAVTDLIDLVAAVDGILQAQSAADARYLMSMLGRQLGAEEAAKVSSTFLQAYRYQYIVSGLQRTRFPSILFGMLTDAQRARVDAALAPLL